MLVEILVIVGISGLVSACAAWGCPSILKKKKKGDETNEEEGDGCLLYTSDAADE